MVNRSEAVVDIFIVLSFMFMTFLAFSIKNPFFECYSEVKLNKRIKSLKKIIKWTIPLQCLDFFVEFVDFTSFGLEFI